VPVLTWQFVKLTEKGGKPIVPFNPLIILVIVLAVIVIIAWRFRTRKNVAKDRQLKSSASTKCQICGQDNPLEAGFCGNCGATLLAAVEAPRPAVAPVVTVEYVGGMTRLGAAIIDGVIVLIILVGLTGFRYWFGFIGLLWLFLLVCQLYHWLFIGLRGQTPGKMAVGIKVVDAQGNRPTLRVAALREVLGKVISTVVLFLGFLWIDIDKQKQGWHDRIADTYVIKVVKAKSTE